MEIVITFLVCALGFAGFIIWSQSEKLKLQDATILELSNSLHNLRLQGDVSTEEFSKGYNKGIEDAERLYKSSLSFMQERYGNILSQMEVQVQQVHRAHVESPTIEYLDELVKRPTQSEKKPVPVSPVLVSGDGMQDISQALGKYG